MNDFDLLFSQNDAKDRILLREEDHVFVEKARRNICPILCGNDPRTLIIVGPCSIHNENSALEYARRIAELQKRVKDTIYLAMRVYFEKPRSTTGWKGILYDPDMDGSENLTEGVNFTRKIMRQIIQMKVPVASEIVDPLCFHFFDDMICWVCIGARTTTSQVHRQNASGMNLFVGFKNDTNGEIKNAINSIVACDISHTFFGIDEEGRLGVYKSKGNPFVHVILRGGKDKPNYYSENITEAVQQLFSMGLNPFLMIDCSHDNCKKNIELMPEVFYNVINQIQEGNSHIKGVMLESHLLPGNQKIAKDTSTINPCISITDPCIGWDKTEEIIMWAHEVLSKQLTKQSA